MIEPVADAAPVSLKQWTAWPSREALSRVARPAAAWRLRWIMRLVVLGGLAWGAFVDARLTDRGRILLGLGLAVSAMLGWGLYRATLQHRLWPSAALLSALIGGAFAADQAHVLFLATVLWCGSAIVAMERMPLVVAVPFTTGALVAYAFLASPNDWFTDAMTALGLGLVGYVVRLDREARANTHRLLIQERAARAAEAESAALRERGRIAREIHDVLAHSLSAQVVHLEAARLLLERGGEREDVLDRVVAARRMARQGLAETWQALSALRGEMTPLEEFLRELVESEGARLTVAGKRRELPAEAGLAVRRVAQEALTNARKHAPGARVQVSFGYLPGTVELEVKDFREQPVDNPGQRPVDNGLRSSGAGYGLLGMRERAELLGGTLEAGPGEEGFVVSLRVPA